MDIKKLNESLDIILEEVKYTTGNTNDALLALIKPGVYITRGQSEVCHNSYPDHWYYFGPYLEPQELFHSSFEIENVKEQNNQIREFNVQAGLSDKYVPVEGELIKTWEEFEYEEDNIHHFYYEEYKITALK